MDDCNINDVRDFEAMLNYLRKLADDGPIGPYEKQITKMFDAIGFHSFLQTADCFSEITRMTINKKVMGGLNKRIHDISLLKYPPECKVKSYGRCNIPGQSVLYASFNMIVINSEMKPLRGDLITTSTWRVKNDYSLRYVPIFKNQPNDGTFNPRLDYFNQQYMSQLRNFPPNVQRKIELLNQFIADAFSKKFDKTNDIDYLYSAYFANKILNQYYNGEVDAIYYPSVQQGLSFENLAIKPIIFDTHYELYSVDESYVAMDYTAGRGGTMSINISGSKDFDLNNNIIHWKKSLMDEDELNWYRQNFGYEE